MASQPDSDRDDQPQAQLDMGDLRRMMLDVQRDMRELKEEQRQRDETIDRQVRQRDETIDRLTQQVGGLREEVGGLREEIRELREELRCGDQIYRLNVEQRNGEQAKSIFRRMYDNVHEHAIIVCTATVLVYVHFVALK